MRKSITVRTPEDISVLNYWLAGCRFERHRISFVVRRSVLEIPFSRVEREKRRKVGGFPFFRRFLVPLEEWVLRISHVKDFQVHPVNSERGIGEDIINAMQFDEAKNRIEVTTAFSRGIDVTVGKFEVDLVDTGVSMKERIEGPLGRYFHFS